MKSGTRDEVKGKTKIRLGEVMRDPTLEGKDKNKIGRVQENIGSVDWEALLNGVFRGKTVIECGADRTIFQQGQPADSLFYIRRGEVKLAVISQQGKEAITAVLSAGEFFGEGCLTGQPLRVATAIAMTDCTLDKIEKSLMVRMLHEQQTSRNCLSRICFHATSDTKRILSTSFSTRAKSVWLGSSCCFLISARKAELKA